MIKNDLRYQVSKISLSIAYDELEETVGSYVQSWQELGSEEFSRMTASILSRLRKSRPSVWKKLSWLLKGAPFSLEGRKELWDGKWSQPNRFREDYYAYAGPCEPAVWRNRGVHIRNAGIVRARLLLAMKTVGALKPRSILEVGCGDGLYSMLMANRFPGVSYTAVDLSTVGIQSAKELQASDALPGFVRAFSPEPELDPQGFKRINFENANAAKLNFDRAQFDLVFTCVALEQMEQIRRKVLSEIARVAREWVLMLEPFSDFSDTPLRREYKKFSHYFDASIDDLRRLEFEPVCVTDDMPQKITLAVPLVVYRRSSG